MLCKTAKNSPIMNIEVVQKNCTTSSLKNQIRIRNRNSTCVWMWLPRLGRCAEEQ